MSDMEETEGTEGPVAPHRVIGTPPPSPRLLGSTAVAEPRESGSAMADDEEVVGVPHNVGLPPDDPKMTSAPLAASKVDWWHGHRMWCVVCSYSATGQPTCVQILE